MTVLKKKIKSLESKKAAMAKLKEEIKTLEGEISTLQLPKDAIFLDNQLGLRYPRNKGYYGFIVSERPAMHIYDFKEYGIAIYNKSAVKVSYVTCRHGSF